jgi:hypothetical protein
MEITLDKGKIQGVVTTAAQAVSNKGFEIPDVLFGLAELIGKSIVDQTGGTMIQKLDVLKPLVEHMERTIRIGCIRQQ